ncbi:Methylmalonic aciduria type A [Phytophthora fragariae]|uniref:Methylmalonic aciduria type A n=1 Tax=Phytophthora fragariae TaxID=53985 RepID=A0A6A3S1S3_9STRA|nr:Methylmalonic aciduria type A [Phytophthora fragariae]KAE8936335.1 Methylmalonic aciduria type A [Phytophthora fragariae]KAE9006959.1 Methylmalonic aciduria type A [Phytophthora fragariae]KAE9107941.1 Methylmalonic aciduria type A [Phytophthora fragariae]KAE9143202.1 Methylmalonic aciduria type A [Phytophthora fragariae]
MLRVVGQGAAAVATAARRTSVQLPGAAHARLLSAATSSIEMRPMTRRLADGVLQGNRTALSRSITLVESTLKSDEEQAELLLDSVLAQRRSLKPAHVDSAGLTSFRLGIAGPPGAGKSTFIETLGQFLTAQGHKVAVLAIDPSSSRSGGSILGDKTRMEKLSNDPNAFVRPSPTRGTLGGVAQHTNDIVLLCEAGGYDIILVESVGLGQSEIVIDDTVDMVMLLVPPAGGDELQGQKKGIVEIADIVVVNKADGELAAPAKHTAVDYMHAMHLMRRKDPDWEPKVKMISALEKKGIDKVWAIVEEYRKTMGELDKIAQKRNAQSSKWMWNQLNEQLMRSVSRSAAVRHKADKMKEDLVHGFISPRSAAANVLELFLKSQQEAK